MTAPKKVSAEEIIKQLGFRSDVKFRPFTKSELDARMKPDDPRSEEEHDRRIESDYVRTCGHPI